MKAHPGEQLQKFNQPNNAPFQRSNLIMPGKNYLHHYISPPSTSPPGGNVTGVNPHHHTRIILTTTFWVGVLDLLARWQLNVCFQFDGSLADLLLSSSPNSKDHPHPHHHHHHHCYCSFQFDGSLADLLKSGSKEEPRLYFRSYEEMKRLHMEGIKEEELDFSFLRFGIQCQLKKDKQPIHNQYLQKHNFYHQVWNFLLNSYDAEYSSSS